MRRPALLMVVLCAWLCDVALSAALNGERFDFGFYAGRVDESWIAELVRKRAAAVLQAAGELAEERRLGGLPCTPRSGYHGGEVRRR